MLDIISAKEKLSSFVEVKVSGRQGSSNIFAPHFDPTIPKTLHRAYDEPLQPPVGQCDDHCLYR